MKSIGPMKVKRFKYIDTITQYRELKMKIFYWNVNEASIFHKEATPI